MLKLVMARFFGESSAGFVDAMVRSLPSPAAAAQAKIEATYWALTAPFVAAMTACDADGLMANLTKMYHKPDCESFDAFGRVLSGTLKVGSEVKVLGEAYSLDDQETARCGRSRRLYQARYRVEVTEVPAGCWALVEGVESSLVKTGTLTAPDAPDDVALRRSSTTPCR